MQSAFNSLIVIFGGEELLIDRQLQRVQQSKRKIIRVDGGSLTDAALVDLCDTFDEAPRTVVVDNAQDLTGDKALQSYAERWSGSDRSLVLVAVLRAARLPKVWEKFASLGKKIECAALKPYDDKAFLRFIEQEARNHSVKIPGDVAERFLERVGPNLHRLANEMQKLAVYVGAPGTITKEHIAAVTAITPRSDPFVISDLVAAGDYQRALGRFGLLCAENAEQKTFPLMLSALMRKYEQLVIIRALLDRGGASDEEVAVQVGLNPWVYKTKWLPLVKPRTLADLTSDMNRLCDLDVYVKGGSGSKRTMFEIVLLHLAKQGVTHDAS